MHFTLNTRTILSCTAMLLYLLSVPQTALSKEKTHALTGKASWYGDYFHGRLTASGAVYDMFRPTAAHKTLPFGTVVEVKDTSTQLTTVVCITDRGPYIRGRIIDLSRLAGLEMDLGTRGVTPVTVRIVSDTKGTLLNDKEAFFVRIPPEKGSTTKQHIGPYANFADACVIHEIMRTKHPKATIVIDKRTQTHAPKEQSLQSSL